MVRHKSVFSDPTQTRASDFQRPDRALFRGFRGPTQTRARDFQHPDTNPGLCIAFLTPQDQIHPLRRVVPMGNERCIRLNPRGNQKLLCYHRLGARTPFINTRPRFSSGFRSIVRTTNPFSTFSRHDPTIVHSWCRWHCDIPCRCMRGGLNKRTEVSEARWFSPHPAPPIRR